MIGKINNRTITFIRLQGVLIQNVRLPMTPKNLPIVAQSVIGKEGIELYSKSRKNSCSHDLVSWTAQQKQYIFSKTYRHWSKLALVTANEVCYVQVNTISV